MKNNFVLIFLLFYLNVFAQKQTEINLTSYEKMREILIKNFDKLPEKQSYMYYNSLGIYKSNYDTVFKRFANEDEILIKSLLKDNNISILYILNKDCITFVHKRKWMCFFWWKEKSVIYHSLEQCDLLLPASIGGKIKINEKINDNWQLIEVLDHIGPPS